jgi:pimeloyl-ACP methyl ester carboxylesterase
VNDVVSDPEIPVTQEEATLASYPGARLPERRERVSSSGITLSLSEWGDANAPPVLLAHGGFDFSQTFSVLAPLLARAGYRVISWDQRGHGDSEHAPLYSWESDLRDALCVLDRVTSEPIPFIGHSKGGNLLTQLALACPQRVTRLVSIDGLPSRSAQPDVANHERTRLFARELSGWLDHRRRTALHRRPTGTLEELARRRARMNPRLSHEWLCFLVSCGARKEAEGWRWKIDPALRFGGFGPWRPQWALQRLPGLSPPLLGLLAGQREPMGFDSTLEDLSPFLPQRARIETFGDAGHFIHIEQPETVAECIVEFLKS